MACIVCGRRGGTIDDFRGQAFATVILQSMSNARRAELTSQNRPLLCCIPCRARLSKANAASGRSLGAQSPDTSTSLPSQIQSSNSSSEVNQYSSGSIVRRASPQSHHEEDIASQIPPPRNPALLNQYNQIIARPGPKSLKRRLINELERQDDDQENRNLSEAEINRIRRNVRQGIRHHHRGQSSTTSTSSNQSIAFSSEISQIPASPPVVIPSSIMQPVISTPSMNPPPPRAPVRVPAVTPSQPSTPHSNGGAPRRISPIIPASLGSSGRGARQQGAKTLGG